MIDPEAVIIFDSDCVLCSRMVAFVLAHERAAEFSFVSAWSPRGLALAAAHGFSRADLDRTFLVVLNGRAFSHSDAGVELLRRMRAPWRWLAIMRFAPRFPRDFFYDVIARHRYRWFGRKVDCVVVPPGMRHRFPDSMERAGSDA